MTYRGGSAWTPTVVTPSEIWLGVDANPQSKKENRTPQQPRGIRNSSSDGKKMDLILRALGYAPSFHYEKFRAEWSDGKGHVVVDETPIGNFCEIEGPPRWIDATAKKLGVTPADYITKNYAGLFSEWKARTKSRAKEMTFTEVKQKKFDSRSQ